MSIFEIQIQNKAQLIDLNNTKKNFELDFKVSSLDKEEFSALVIDKHQLDQEKDLDNVELKQSTGGFIKGTVSNNENKEDTSYFLVIKKDGEPCTGRVEIELREIEAHTEEAYPIHNYSQKETSLTNLFNKYFYHLMGALIFVSVVYYLYKYKNQHKLFPSRISDISSTTSSALPSTSSTLPPTSPTTSSALHSTSSTLPPTTSSVLPPTTSSTLLPNSSVPSIPSATTSSSFVAPSLSNKQQSLSGNTTHEFLSTLEKGIDV